MKSPNGWEERIPISHSFSPSETSIIGIGLHLIELLPEGVSRRRPQIIQSVAENTSCLPLIEKIGYSPQSASPHY